MRKQKHKLWQTITLAGVSYLLGSIPFSYLVARARGVDLRTVGSGNIGSSNVWRSCGFGSFLAAMTGDMLKGAAMPLVAIHGLRLPPTSVIVIGSGAIAGHTRSIFMQFKGGKAVATTAGVLLAIFPPGTLIGALVWGALIRTTRIASLSSLLAAAVVVALALTRTTQRRLDPSYAIFICGAGGAIVYLHRSNIQRLLAGTENRFGKLLS
jgi:glycerol-3-phosphate acyltransferase PlsY